MCVCVSKQLHLPQLLLKKQIKNSVFIISIYLFTKGAQSVRLYRGTSVIQQYTVRCHSQPLV